MSKNLPSGFVARIQADFPEHSEALIKALSSSEPEVSVRVNPLKGVAPLDKADRVPWCPDGFYLPARPLFAADPAWHQGLYYVQDASSMAVYAAVRHIVREFFDAGTPLRCLDACAAPGGKTGAALSALPYGSLVIANEFDRHRANILDENICKTGSPYVAVTRGDAVRFGSVPAAFDIILADVPCSGEGMMRKDDEAVSQWIPELIRNCAATQRVITDALWNALRPGGVMVYSTCTFNRDENEEIVSRLMEEHNALPVALPLGSYSGVVGGLSDFPAYRFLPGCIRGEGLFMAALRKSPDANPASKKRRKALRPKADATLAAFARDVLAVPSEFILNGSCIIPTGHADFLGSLEGTVDFLRQGIRLGTSKGRDIVPSHDLAMSAVLRPDCFPTLELNYEEALAYLRGEGLSDLPAELPRGYFITTYAGRPLGFAKNVGRRANNLYPDAMRLRLSPSSLPSEAPKPLLTPLQ